MAIYFGARRVVQAVDTNYRNVGNWYSDPGASGKDSYSGVLLNRLPTQSDDIVILNGFSSNVGYWTGGTYPTGSWVNSNTVNNVITIDSIGYVAVNQLQANLTFNNTVYLRREQGYTTGISPGPGWKFNGDLYCGQSSYNIGYPTYRQRYIWPIFESGHVVSGNTSGSLKITPGAIFNGKSITAEQSGSSQEIGCVILGGTISANISGYLTIYANSNPIITSKLANLAEFRLANGTFTLPIESQIGTLTIIDGTMNSTNLTPNITNFVINGGTMANKISSKCSGVSIQGGFLTQTEDFIFGQPGSPVYLSINTNGATDADGNLRPAFAGTSKNITIYANTVVRSSGYSDPPQFGGLSLDAGTYTGLIKIFVTSASGNGAPRAIIYGGIHRPVVTIPLLNSTSGTGKSIDSNLTPTNYGFSIYSANVYISGSSDILQSAIQ